VRAIKQEKKRIVDIYASGDLSREDYVKKNLAYDDEGDVLERRKAELLRRTAA
jgi:hypothetical protein